MAADTDVCTPSAVLERASLVLDAFEGGGPITLAQVVGRTGLPRSSVHRILERLVQLRWLRRVDRRYELGMRLVELGSLAIHQDRLHRAALPFLHKLAHATGLAVHLAVLDGVDVVYLAKVGDPVVSAAIPTRVGGRHPAHCTGVGRAILAYLDQESLVDLGTGPLRRITKYSLATRAQLTAELTKVRAHGIAYEREESLPGFGCVAAPIGDAGEVVAAVSVCGQMGRMAFDHRLAAPVRSTALSIWRSIDDGRVRIHPALQQPRLLGRESISAGPERIVERRTLRHA